MAGAKTSSARSTIAAPNVVMILADQLNSRNVGCYATTQLPEGAADAIHTPVIDGLARDGALFETAYCQSPLCMPSRSSFNTGLYPHAARVLHNPMVLKEEFPTLAERLASHGYHTAGFGHIGGDGVERGFRTKVDLVDSPLRDAYLSEQRYVRSLGTAHPAGMYGAHPFADEDLLDDRTCRLACDWINRAEGPFFLQVDFMNPHIPLLAPKRHVDRYRVHDISLPPSAHDGLRDRPANVRGTR